MITPLVHATIRTCLPLDVPSSQKIPSLQRRVIAAAATAVTVAAVTAAAATAAAVARAAAATITTTTHDDDDSRLLLSRLACPSERASWMAAAIGTAAAGAAAPAAGPAAAGLLGPTWSPLVDGATAAARAGTCVSMVSLPPAPGADLDADFAFYHVLVRQARGSPKGTPGTALVLATGRPATAWAQIQRAGRKLGALFGHDPSAPSPRDPVQYWDLSAALDADGDADGDGDADADGETTAAPRETLMAVVARVDAFLAAPSAPSVVPTIVVDDVQAPVAMGLVALPRMLLFLQALRRVVAAHGAQLVVTAQAPAALAAARDADAVPLLATTDAARLVRIVEDEMATTRVRIGPLTSGLSRGVDGEVILVHGHTPGGPPRAAPIDSVGPPGRHALFTVQDAQVLLRARGAST
ncbi:hypothetical protein CXG81DRAFT_16611 [Caulochytrium protostelioides]|uniref:Elongator complex protein 6 n=1 Tax=Caulochytrium protostelioides TaxID=1555241 RepID=A0A4P9XED7_9FUNG|nr:hypothetical protein CXG81DRAFT_16611 [Caulochytrium protostelioides]|eukprot:RKP03905.1 hypothetical protein CXG81DRAFT_16611 [Caulochytrium protostelioides]